MKTKKIVAILVGVALVAFGIGLLSLNHHGFSIKQNNGVNIGLNGIDINSNGSKVEIGPGGIHVEDGNKNTSLEVNSGFSGWLKRLFNGITITNKDLIEKDIDEEKYEEIAGINHIDIESSFVDVNIIPENRDDIKIHYNGHLKANYIPQLETNKSDSTLRIYFKRNKTNSYTITNSTVKLDVYIPNTYKDSIMIDSSSGDLGISSVELLELKLSASSGDITVENITLDNLFIETSSGDQIVKNVTSNDVNLSASSGYITIEEAALDKLFMGTSSGDQKLNDVTSIESNLTASSGTIEVLKHQGELYTTTSSGDVKLDYSSFDNNIVANASSGKIKIVLPKDSQFSLYADTSSGRIEVDFPIKILSKDDDTLSGTVGDSSNTIEVRTTSGDIWIRSK